MNKKEKDIAYNKLIAMRNNYLSDIAIDLLSEIKLENTNICPKCSEPRIELGDFDDWYTYTCTKCKETQWVKYGPLSDGDRALIKAIEWDNKDNKDE